MHKKTVRVVIKGTTPLLMHAFPDEPIENIEKETDDDDTLVIEPKWRPEVNNTFIRFESDE